MTFELSYLNLYSFLHLSDIVERSLFSLGKKVHASLMVVVL